MKGSEIYDSIVTRCLDINIEIGRELGYDVLKFSELFHSAVLCMGANPVTPDHDIYRTYFEREAVRMSIDLWSRQPAPTSNAEECNLPGAFLEPLSFYLPKNTEILNVHIEAYKKLTTIIPKLWGMYELKAAGRELTTGNHELTAITTYLMGDIVEAVRQLHVKFNKDENTGTN